MFVARARSLTANARLKICVEVRRVAEGSLYLRIKIIILEGMCYNRNGVVRNILRKILRTSWLSLSTVSFYLRIKIIIQFRRCYNRNGVVRNILRKILRTSWFSLSTVSFYLRIKIIILD